MNSLPQGISSKIMQLPNRPRFMLDSDVAEIYGISTRKINQAANRNSDRFPEEFRFQLDREEMSNLKFQNGTSSLRCQNGTLKDSKITNCDLRGLHRKYLPYGYTREGCNMLSAVLNTPSAIQRSIQIMKAFSAIEREIETGQTLGRFASLIKEVSHEVKELKSEVSHLKSRPSLNINLPDDEALPIAIERKVHSRNKSEINRNKEAKELAILLLSEGFTYENAVRIINNHVPGFKTSTSFISRFWQAYRLGYLKHN